MLCCRRLYQLDKSTSDPAHPYSKFGTGDSRTLRDTPRAAGVDVRERIVAFRELAGYPRRQTPLLSPLPHIADRKYYSASTMALVILGREPVETLRGWAVDKFTAVPNNGATPRSLPSHPYTTCLGVQLWAVPVKDTRSFTVTWPLPDTRARERAKGGRSGQGGGAGCPTFPLPSLAAGPGTKSDSYLSHLIGHEGPGSILSLLVSRAGMAVLWWAEQWEVEG